MAILLTKQDVYRVDTAEEAEDIINDAKEQAATGGYLVSGYKSTYKTKKSKGQIIEDGYEVVVIKKYADFWEATI